MPGLLLILSQSGYLIQTVAINLHTWWQTVQIQISWLLQKPTDLDLHCLKNRIYPGSAGQGLRLVFAIPKWGFCYSISNITTVPLIRPLLGRTIDWLCWGLTTHQPLWVILCRLPETGRKEIEEIVEEMKENTGKKEEQEWKWRNRRNKNIPLLPLPATRIAGLAQL